MHTYQGYGRCVRVDDAEWIYLEPTGLMPGLRRGNGIPLRSVVGVHLVEATLFRNGYMQLILADNPTPALLPVGPNSLMFLRQHNSNFAALRDWLIDVAATNRSLNTPPAALQAVEPASPAPITPPVAPAATTHPSAVVPPTTHRSIPSTTPRVRSSPPRSSPAAPPLPAAKQHPSRGLTVAPLPTRGVAAAPGRLQHSTGGGVDRSIVGPLASLLAGADRIAVVDVETTGLYPGNRVVEVAVVTIDRRGAVIDEFDSLVNPLRDPGPTWIHGLTSTTLRPAPTFDDIALHLAALLDGAVIAAHNLPFDSRFLSYEFNRVGIDIDWGVGLDTLTAAGGRKLEQACTGFGIDLQDAHRALGDARATAELVLQVVGKFGACRPAAASPVSSDVPRTLTRDGLTQDYVERPYVLELSRNLRPTLDTAAYAELLDYAVADLKLDSDERAELTSLAAELGLTEQDRTRAHRQFLNGLLDAATAAGMAGDLEFDLLCRIAALLEIDDSVVRSRLNPLRRTTGTLDIRAGMRVCFTGAAETLTGVALEREDLVSLTRRYELQPIESVTKSGCDLLIAADPSTMSGKAKDARRFGIPIASAADYQVALIENTPLMVERIPASRVGLVCTTCGYAWMAERRQNVPVCDGCREAAKPPRSNGGHHLVNDVGRRGGGSGVNVANIAQRRDRLERCRQAVDLQRRGASREEIGRQLVVSVDAVKSLLRDGKFYAAPEQDQPRLKLAEQAAQARVDGLTRAAFATKAVLGKGRAEECWRDSDVLFDKNGQRHPLNRKAYS